MIALVRYTLSAAPNSPALHRIMHSYSTVRTLFQIHYAAQLSVSDF